ncbi:histidinol dehydrogenase [Sporosarcina jeotgali]|uniref:Histidinol dehydrogenase n=1 Tax=Sporosarcina jeotgali TaxID=3020056 RepID=A0ABZ0KSP6_9BACL|nr:histidinol dehydrogenase [Sporosarcina sp. B2O-1]WOV83320.1 histidinol dehydrogenase [Sporosarcina sp. B2O-1]
MQIITTRNQITKRIARRTSASPVEKTVRTIIDRVKKFQDAELLALTERFDGVTIQTLQVSKQEILDAYQKVSSSLLQAMKDAKERIQRFHEQQKEESWRIEPEEGVYLGQQVRPLASAGIYIPGGKASYPSTVLMNAIPAKIAGVKRIVLTTPPQADGTVNAAVLVAADLCGVDEIYKVGGAQAIAALAYGTESIQPVLKITGPGNAYVACAKKLVFGDVSIDMIAGPSEVCIWTDEQSDLKFVAADLLAQAEHDEDATACCLVPSIQIAEALSTEVNRQLELMDRMDIAKKSIQTNGWIAVVESESEAIDIINELAPEHLEIMTANPENSLDDIENAGAIFLGAYSPEALGDYVAGPNHTLPTSGTAKFSSPLGVYDFVKKTSIIRYTENALEHVSDAIIELANTEQLTGHAQAIRVRT